MWVMSGFILNVNELSRLDNRVAHESAQRGRITRSGYIFTAIDHATRGNRSVAHMPTHFGLDIRDRQVPFRVPRETLAIWKAKAKAAGMSYSEWSRRIVLDRIQRDETAQRDQSEGEETSEARAPIMSAQSKLRAERFAIVEGTSKRKHAEMEVKRLASRAARKDQTLELRMQSEEVALGAMFDGDDE